MGCPKIGGVLKLPRARTHIESFHRFAFVSASAQKCHQLSRLEVLFKGFVQTNHICRVNLDNKLVTENLWFIFSGEYPPHSTKVETFKFPCCPSRGRGILFLVYLFTEAVGFWWPSSMWGSLIRLSIFGGTFSFLGGT